MTITIKYPCGTKLSFEELRRRLVLECQDGIIEGIFNGGIHDLLKQTDGHVFGTLIEIIEKHNPDVTRQKHDWIAALRKADELLFGLYNSGYGQKTRQEKDQIQDQFAAELAPVLDQVIKGADTMFTCVRYVELCQQSRFGYVSEKGIFHPIGLNIVDDL